MEIEIRLATPDDTQAIAEVHVRGCQAAYASFLDSAWLAALSVDERRKGWDERLAEQNRLGPLVAVDGSQVVAFASFGPIGSEFPLPSGYAGLYTLYVDPGYYSQGIGAALLEASLRVLVEAGYTHASLWCYEPNHGARRFYEREGWRLNGERHSYESGPDAVRYIRELV